MYPKIISFPVVQSFCSRPRARSPTRGIADRPLGPLFPTFLSQVGFIPELPDWYVCTCVVVLSCKGSVISAAIRLSATGQKRKLSATTGLATMICSHLSAFSGSPCNSTGCCLSFNQLTPPTSSTSRNHVLAMFERYTVRSKLIVLMAN
jgi:hypothetical protein